MTGVTACSNVKAANVTAISDLNDHHDHTGDDQSSPIVGQTQSKYEAKSLCNLSDDEDSHIITSIRDSEQNDIATHINTIFDQVDDYLAVEIHDITDHRYLSGVLEFQVERSDGELS